MTSPVFLTALLLAASPITASAEEEKASAEGSLEVAAGRIEVSSGTPGLSGAGIQEGGKPAEPEAGPAAAAPVFSAAAPYASDDGVAWRAAFGTAGGCMPPQPGAPCKIDWHWDGKACIDGQALLVRSATSKGWSNDAWRDYFFSLIKKKGLPSVALPASIAAVEPELVARGAGLQRNSAGEIRGRLFLPTGDLNDRWSRSVDVVQGAGWCDPWGWVIR